MDVDWIVRGLIGGVLIGTASALLLLFNGRIAGISGILGGTVVPRPQDTSWRIMFIAGLLSGGAILAVIRPDYLPFDYDAPVAPMIVAGLLVGFGTQLGSGCTSGHGVCGIGRMSPRSIVATLTFIATGAIAVLVVRAIYGGGA